MKIFCIGRNYVAHIAELGNDRPTAPVVFMKPDTALLRNNEDFYIPDFSQDIHHEVELVLRVGKEGKNIQPQFAHKYIDGIGLGIDFTARDLQAGLKAKGLPWEISKSFNSSAPISHIMPVPAWETLQQLHFHLDVNGERRQTGDTALMLFPLEELVAYISQFFHLKHGDLIYTGTPEGVAAVKASDRLQGYLPSVQEAPMFDFLVK
jgi:2-keto-4-pentenoate hydratase/2-oxohepta-3-ene-1,7-dioic acid hydratase in catechol pathway